MTQSLRASAAAQPSTSGASNDSNEIVVGSQVCQRKVPMYHTGSIGFTVAGGVPKVGQLLNSAWNVTDTCRFKIIQPPKKPKLPELPKEKERQKEDYDSASMPPPPSPASSTCSDGSLSSPASCVVASSGSAPTGAAAPAVGTRRQKRSAPKEEPEKVDEEEWNLKDVIFVEDSRNIPIGRVWKVDGLQTLVHFPPMNVARKESKDPAAAAAEDSGPMQLNSSNVRILSRDQLQLVKQGALPKAPDCFQRTPKKVCLQQPDNTQILTLNIDGKGIHAIVKIGDKTCYRLFNVSTGKQELDSKFPTDTQAFLGLDATNNIKFLNTGESEFVSILLDGNRTVYPLVKDSTPQSESLKDPQWLDLPPLSALGLGTHALPHVGSGKKNEVAVIVFSFTPQTMMPKILQCDADEIRKIVANLEDDPTAISTVENVQSILEERCDGGRNIIHTLVSMCQPTSNKDADQDSNQPASGLVDSVGIAALSSAMNLRDLMRRASR